MGKAPRQDSRGAPLESRAVNVALWRHFGSYLQLCVWCIPKVTQCLRFEALSTHGMHCLGSTPSALVKNIAVLCLRPWRIAMAGAQIWVCVCVWCFQACSAPKRLDPKWQLFLSDLNLGGFWFQRIWRSDLIREQQRAMSHVFTCWKKLKETVLANSLDFRSSNPEKHGNGPALRKVSRPSLYQWLMLPCPSPAQQLGTGIADRVKLVYNIIL